MTQTTFTNLYPKKYSRDLRYYSFAGNLDRYAESFNTHGDLSSRVRITNETEDLNLHVFNIIIGINESKTLTKHISCKYECKFDGRKCNSNQKRNNDKCRCECKNPKEHGAFEKDHIWNAATYGCRIG